MQPGISLALYSPPSLAAWWIPGWPWLFPVQRQDKDHSCLAARREEPLSRTAPPSSWLAWYAMYPEHRSGAPGKAGRGLAELQCPPGSSHPVPSCLTLVSDHQSQQLGPNTRHLICSCLTASHSPFILQPPPPVSLHLPA